MNIKQRNTYDVCSKNINQFIKFVKILTAEGLSDFKPYKFQIKLLRKFANSWKYRKEKKHNHIIVAPRQCGKTTIGAIYALWFALFNNDKTIAILSYKIAAAQEMLYRIREIYELLPEYFQPTNTLISKERIAFSNGSKIIIGNPEANSVKGRHVDLIIFDEMAFCHEKMLYNFMMSVFPTISASANTQAIFISTPHGDNEFYKLYEKAKSGTSSFVATRLRYDCVPGRDEAWKEKTIRDYGIKFFEQEYNASFILNDYKTEDSKITITIDTRPMSQEKAKSLMTKLKKLYSKVLSYDKIEDANYEIKYE